MRRLVAALRGAPLLAAATPPTMCRPGEAVYFNCQMGKAHKVASLCGHEAAPRYLQYRFGLPGQAPELQVPDTTTDPAMGRTFFYEYGKRADERNWGWDVWFHHADTVYQLSDFIDLDDAPHGAASVDYFVGRAEGAPKTLACANADGGKALQKAEDLIREMSPPDRTWQQSPYDERLHADQAASAARR